jgi:hypothetical protein
MNGLSRQWTGMSELPESGQSLRGADTTASLKALKLVERLE